MLLFKMLMNLFRTKTAFLAIYATLYEIMGHEWKQGKLVCEHPKYAVRCEQYYQGKLVGIFEVETDICHDLGS